MMNEEAGQVKARELAYTTEDRVKRDYVQVGDAGGLAMLKNNTVNLPVVPPPADIMRRAHVAELALAMLADAVHKASICELLFDRRAFCEVDYWLEEAWRRERK